MYMISQAENETYKMVTRMIIIDILCLLVCVIHKNMPNQGLMGHLAVIHYVGHKYVNHFCGCESCVDVTSYPWYHYDYIKYLV